ncbi:MAG TPA: hypothetical protein VLK22_00490 [Candidatus Udaeobacter sp.]|nr:hypothetical protein [Candidatus Udaeobacter sp.]
MEKFAIEAEKIGELENFRREIRKIKARLVDDKRKAGNDEYDATLAEVDVDKLGETEMKIWQEYKDVFAKVYSSFDDTSDAWKNVQEQNVNPLVKNIKKF